MLVILLINRRCTPSTFVADGLPFFYRNCFPIGDNSHLILCEVVAVVVFSCVHAGAPVKLRLVRTSFSVACEIVKESSGASSYSPTSRQLPLDISCQHLFRSNLSTNIFSIPVLVVNRILTSESTITPASLSSSPPAVRSPAAFCRPSSPAALSTTRPF